MGGRFLGRSGKSRMTRLPLQFYGEFIILSMNKMKRRDPEAPNNYQVFD
jgi:hypothetical protein